MFYFYLFLLNKTPKSWHICQYFNMACCGDASGWAKIGFICIILAFGLQSAALLTNYWMVYKTAKNLFDVRVGLFWYTNCSSGCGTSVTPSSFQSCEYNIQISYHMFLNSLSKNIILNYSSQLVWFKTLQILINSYQVKKWNNNIHHY